MRKVIKGVALALLAQPLFRSMLNVLYNASGEWGRRKLYTLCAKIFRGRSHSFTPSTWNVNVAPFRLTLPMRPDWAWLDWDAALASLGNDQEVKGFYAAVLQSRHRPAVFLDIGANYGVHTSLMKSAGIDTISFEPNTECLQYFNEVRKLNHGGSWAGGTWHQVALGSAPGSVRLAFPDKNTWFGHIAGANEDLTGLKVTEVQMKRLDDFNIKAAPILVKIDAEGSELAILKGGHTLLTTSCSFFIFESLDKGERASLLKHITDMGFLIHKLPVENIESAASLSSAGFEAEGGTNFVARNTREIARS